MSEKEMNQLKRGRVQGKANVQKKKSLVGEISDPLSVFNDSISAKNRSEDLSKDDYMPSKRVNCDTKTTTVDGFDPLINSAEKEPIITKKEVRNERDYNRNNFRRETRNSDSTHRNYERKKEPNSNVHQNSESIQNQNLCDDSKKCSIKHFFCKILKFFGFKSSCKSSCCSSKDTNETLSKNSFKSTSKNSNCHNSRRHGGYRRSKPFQKKP